MRALGPEIFGSPLERRHFEECNEHIRETNEEDSKEGNLMLLKELVMPAVGTPLGKYIDDWLSREAMSVTGIPVTAIPIEDQIRFTYPRREGGFGCRECRNYGEINSESFRTKYRFFTPHGAPGGSQQSQGA